VFAPRSVSESSPTSWHGSGGKTFTLPLKNADLCFLGCFFSS